jgi:hypothetical protein
MKKTISILSCLLLTASLVQAQTEDMPQTPPANVYAVNTNVDRSLNTNQEDDPTGRSKTFSKTFTADQSDKINLSNQYGSIVIKTWDRREVKADVQITAYSNNDSDAQKLLDEVNIEASKSGDQIGFATRIEDTRGNWGSGTRNGRKWRREVKVNYVVYMPASNPLNVSQQYGNVTMGDFSGPVNAKVQYGNFKAGNLSSASTNLSVQYGNTDVLQMNRATIKQQYGSGLTIGTVGTLNLSTQYAKTDIKTITGEAVIKQQYGDGLTLGTVGQLTLNAQYTKVKIQSVKRNTNAIKIQYGGLEIGSIDNLNLSAQYTGVSIANLAGDCNFNVQYNNLNVQQVSEACKRLIVDAQYVKVALNFADNYNANVDVQTSYASFTHGNTVAARQVGADDDDSSTKIYSGKIGNGSTNYVKVKSAYGNVSFQ